MEDTKTTGVAMALLERFETQKLPTALAIKEKVDKGGLLSETDIDFLNQVFEDSSAVQNLIDTNSEWQSLYARIVDLYSEIMKKALENETAADSSISN